MKDTITLMKGTEKIHCDRLEQYVTIAKGVCEISVDRYTWKRNKKICKGCKYFSLRGDAAFIFNLGVRYEKRLTRKVEEHLNSILPECGAKQTGPVKNPQKKQERSQAAENELPGDQYFKGFVQGEDDCKDYFNGYAKGCSGCIETVFDHALEKLNYDEAMESGNPWKRGYQLRLHILKAGMQRVIMRLNRLALLPGPDDHPYNKEIKGQLILELKTIGLTEIKIPGAKVIEWPDK